jgi:hypothetical protein
VGIAATRRSCETCGTPCPKICDRLAARGIDGFFMDLEPHLKGGGQFGGFSGPDGFGVATRALCRLLDYVGIPYALRTFDDVRPG